MMQPNFLTEKIKKLFAEDQIVYENEGEMLVLCHLLVKRENFLDSTKFIVTRLCYASMWFKLDRDNNNKIIASMTSESKDKINESIDRLFSEGFIPWKRNTLKYNAKPLIEALIDSYEKMIKLLDRFKLYRLYRAYEMLQETTSID